MYEVAFALRDAYDLRFSPDERSLLAVRGARVESWDVAGGAVAASQAMRDPGAADFAPDGSRVLVSTRTGACLLADPATLEPGPRISGRGLKLSPGALFGPDGRHYVHLGWEWGGNLVVRDAETGETVRRERHEGRVADCLTCTPDRATFAWASAAENGAAVLVRRWPFSEHSATVAVRSADLRGWVWALAIAPDGRLALHQGDRVSVWQHGTCLAARPIEFSGTAYSVAWTPDGVVTIDDEGAVGLSPDLEPLWRVDVPYPCAVACSPSGAFVAVGSWERAVVLRRTL